MSHDAAMVVWVLLLWGAVFGICAPRTSRSAVCRWSKVLAAISFVGLVVEVGLDGPVY